MMQNNTLSHLNNEDIEIKLLLEGIFLKYGYDFRNYSQAHIKRRILRRLTISKLDSISEMIYKILQDRDYFEILLMDFSINVTEMFRDPAFYEALRKDVIPILKTYPFIKIWHAGCSTGEEAYSMAILLKEEGLYDRCQIYATDFNETVLQKAKAGRYPIDQIKEYTYNYQQSGGLVSFSDYYTVKADCAIIDEELKEKIIFADHNLVIDGVFGEMNVIICRNVLIYFNRELQDRVITLFYDSLNFGGVLCLGSKESLRFSSHEERFRAIDLKHRIFQKKFEV
ncbi:CheR family methyltransferase [Cellulosilyticum sp. I15G10I2]|uniref:CheR family methyltransferase n=1 Tax=Cellulosilyticum sp. I15G10I2 TaxID=1892843 RepID=UPI00085C5D16|nr:protein-glutamate O-methyltransferase CheR [Cellulosilyticum sp. I15G10I2]